MDCGVYQIKHVASGRLYIGSSKRLHRRLQTHQASLRRGRHHSIKLQRAWDKYGADAFEISVILYCAEKDRLDYEQRLMDGLGACSAGFNVLPKAGTSTDGKFHPETLAKYLVRRRELARKYEWKGGRHSLAEIAEQEGIRAKLLYCRVLEKGWPLERAALAPVQKQRRTIAALGKELTIPEWAGELGVVEDTLRGALERGESIEQVARRQKRITLNGLCGLLGVHGLMVVSRMKSGWSVMHALTVPKASAAPKTYTSGDRYEPLRGSRSK